MNGSKKDLQGLTNEGVDAEYQREKIWSNEDKKMKENG